MLTELLGVFLEYKSLLYVILYAVFIVFILDIVLRWKYTTSEKLPPSPFRLPILGNVYLIRNSNYHKLFTSLAAKHGPIFTFWFFGQPVIIINNIEVMREALLNKAANFSGRMVGYSADLYSPGFKGILASGANFSEDYKKRRNISHRAMTMYVEGKGNVEEIIETECQFLKKRLSELSTDGKPTDLHEEVLLSTLNVICSLVFGRSFARDDPDFKDFAEVNRLVDLIIGFVNLLDSFPIIRFLPIKRIQQIFELPKLRDPIIERELKRHEQSFTYGKIRDFCDAMLLSATETSKLNGYQGLTRDEEALSSDNRRQILADLMFAGSHSSARTLLWIILYLTKFQECQDKLQKELDSVLNQSNQLSYDSKPFLPYLEAVIHESLRLSSLAYLGAPHRATKDGVLQGYDVPKGTQLVFNLYSMNHDERYWQHPERFNPDRFLDKSGKFVIPNNSFAPFGIGKRSCLGEVLVKKELFLVTGNLFTFFNFRAPGNGECLDTEPIATGTLSPKRFKVNVIPRDDVKNF